MVFDGSNSGGIPLGVLSGSSLPAAMTASSGSMFISFAADSSVESTGFTAAYSTGSGLPSVPSPVSIPAAGVPSINSPSAAPPAASSGATCSGAVTLSSPSGTITDGPGSYASMTTCSWQISLGSPITLQFDSFSTEGGYDIVNVYDGTGLSGAFLGSFSGPSPPSAVTANSGNMYVSFTSDSSVESTGFSASYASGTNAGTFTAPVPAATPVSAPSAPTTITIPSTVSTISDATSMAACSGNVDLYGASGSISDGPGSYASNMACSWTISSGSRITVSFDSFNTEQNYDFVEVYDGSARIGRFSGATVPGSLIARSGSMVIRFSADGSVENGGFTATYSSDVTASALAEAAPMEVQSPVDTGSTFPVLIIGIAGAVVIGAVLVAVGILKKISSEDNHLHGDPNGVASPDGLAVQDMSVIFDSNADGTAGPTRLTSRLAWVDEDLVNNETLAAVALQGREHAPGQPLCVAQGIVADVVGPDDLDAADV